MSSPFIIMGENSSTQLFSEEESLNGSFKRSELGELLHELFKKLLKASLV